jgi:lysophospholipase L1-like esterase
MRCLAPVLVLLGTATLLPAPAQEKKEAQSSRWEKTIEAFEKSDQAKPPPRNAILFVGSSTIRLWKVEKAFPNLEVINRGFGGSQIADVVQYTPRIVVKYQPRLIVFFAGDNDLAAGKTPERVRDDFKAFVEAVRKDLPKTQVLFLSIKPSVARWKLFEQQQKANALIETYCSGMSGVSYIDMVKPMLGSDGKPRAELFVKDGLHLNEEGYKVWGEIVKPLLK